MILTTIIVLIAGFAFLIWFIDQDPVIIENSYDFDECLEESEFKRRMDHCNEVRANG